MDIKKLFIRMTVGIGIIGLIITILLITNSKSSLCRDGHQNVTEGEQKYCYYINVTCGMNETAILQPVGENQTGDMYKCVYTPTGFMDSRVFVYILIFLGLGWLIIFIIFIVDIARKKGNNLEAGMFRKEDFVDADRARHLWKVKFAKENGIPVFGEDGQEIVQGSAFNFYDKQRVFQKGQEWFVGFQCEVTEGRNPGLYTVMQSLSRGEKWILTGMTNYEECQFDDYKFSRVMPLHTAVDMKEQMLQELSESNPEKAEEMRQRILENQMNNPQQSVEQNVSDVPNQIPMYGYPPPRRRRPIFYNRRY